MKAVVLTLLILLVTVSQAAARVFDRSLHVPPPYWLIGGEEFLDGVGGERALRMGEAALEQYSPRYEPGGQSGAEGRLAPGALPWKEWFVNPLSVTRRPKRGGDRSQFQVGLYRFGKKEYQRAAEAFLQLVVKFETSPLRSLALYWLGESQYGSGDWEAAEKTHRILLREEIDDELRSTVLISLGWISQRTGNLEDALEYYRSFLDAFPQAPPVPLVVYRMGEVFYRMKSFKQAAEQFRRVTREYEYFPERELSLFWWGESLRAAGFFSQSREIALEYLSLHPRGRLADYTFYGLGWSYLGEGKYDEAGRVFQQLIVRFPGTFLADEAFLLAGWSLHMDRNYDEAILVLESLADKYPGSPWIKRARFLSTMGNYFLGRHAEARREFEAISSESKSEGYLRGARFMTGMSLVGMNQFGEAAAYFDTLSREEERSVLGKVALLWAGWSAFQAGDYSLAAGMLERYLRLPLAREEMAEAMYWRGEVMTERGEHSEAALSFGRSLEMYPEGPRADDALFGIAEAYYRQGRWRTAAAKFRHLVDSHRDSFFRHEAELLLGESLVHDRRAKEALPVFLAYIDAYLSDGSAAIDRALFLVGGIYLGREEFKKAQATYDRLLEKYPDSPLAGETRFQTARSYYLAGRWDDAIKVYAGIVNGNPVAEERARAYLGMADSFYRLRNFARAEETYRLVVEGGAGSDHVAAAEYGLALVALASGDSDEYKRLSLLFARRHPDNPEVPRLLHQVGRHLLRRKRYREAAEIYSRLVNDYPGGDSGPEILLAAALAERRSESRRKAMEEIRRELAAEPDSRHETEQRFELANLYLEVGSCAGALVEYRRIAGRHSRHPLAPYALLDSAACQIREGDPDAATESYRRLVADYPESELFHEALYHQGSLLLRSGQYREAEKVLRRISPGAGRELRARVAFTLGGILRQLGRKEEAFAEFTRSRNFSPQGRYAVRAAFRAAEIAREYGRREEAAVLYREVLREGGEEVIVELAREGLQTLDAGVESSDDSAAGE
jgi:TolA-binding protein